MRYSADGAAVCTISVAASTSWKDKATGDKREETEWHRIVFYNRLAEIVGEYLRQGSAVYVEGRLKTRKWQAKETGADRYSTEIVASKCRCLEAVAEMVRCRQLSLQRVRRQQPLHRRLVVQSWPMIFRSIWPVRDVAGCACKKVCPGFSWGIY